MTFSQIENTQSLTNEQRDLLDEKIKRYYLAAHERLKKLRTRFFNIAYDEKITARYYKNRDYKDFLLDARWELWNSSNEVET